MLVCSYISVVGVKSGNSNLVICDNHRASFAALGPTTRHVNPTTDYCPSVCAAFHKTQMVKWRCVGGYNYVVKWPRWITHMQGPAICDCVNRKSSILVSC